MSRTPASVNGDYGESGVTWRKGSHQYHPAKIMNTPSNVYQEVIRLREALTTIRTSGNDSAQCIWMQKVVASALEPGKWPDAGKSPLANTQDDEHKSKG